MSQNSRLKYVKKAKSDVIYDLVNKKCDVDLVALQFDLFVLQYDIYVPIILQIEPMFDSLL